MIFGKKPTWEDQYDEDYVARTERRERMRGSVLWIHLAGFSLTVVLALVLAGLIGGQALFENSLVMLASPVGIVWLLLFFASYFCLLYRQVWPAASTIICWLILTVFGNSFVANQLVYQLEQPHLDFSQDNLEKLDVVFLLGGGTSTNLNGKEQVDFSGDRVVTAASLYHAGKVDRIVCTGQQLFRTTDDDLHPNEESSRLLSSLGVPESAIFRVKGVNTSEEMQIALQFLQEQNLDNSRYGIVTSAWHLSRASRLAEKYSMQPILIPADFRSKHFTNGPGLLIPSADSLATSARCFKEHLAWFVNR